MMRITFSTKNSFYTRNMHIHIFLYSFGYDAIDSKNFFFSCTQSTSIGFHGNAVTLWERLYKEYKETGELLVDLGSDQTSCHDPFGGGYYPVQLNFEEANKANTLLFVSNNIKSL